MNIILYEYRTFLFTILKQLEKSLYKYLQINISVNLFMCTFIFYPTQKSFRKNLGKLLRNRGNFNHNSPTHYCYENVYEIQGITYNITCNQ